MNNEVIIRKRKGVFRVSERDLNSKKDRTVIKDCDTMEEAIKVAYDYRDNNEVEYGVLIKA